MKNMGRVMDDCNFRSPIQHVNNSQGISHQTIIVHANYLTEDDIDLGWNTKNDLPDEIIDATFILAKGQVSKPIESSFGWHILKIIDSKFLLFLCTYNQMV